MDEGRPALAIEDRMDGSSMTPGRIAENERAQRNAEIYRRVKNGERPADVGRAFGITGSRVGALRDKIDRMRRHPSKAGWSQDEFLDWYRNHVRKREWTKPFGPFHARWQDTPAEMVGIWGFKSFAEVNREPEHRSDDRLPTVGEIVDMALQGKMGSGRYFGFTPARFSALIDWLRMVGADAEIIDGLHARLNGPHDSGS